MRYMLLYTYREEVKTEVSIMQAKIFKHNNNYFIEYFNEDGQKLHSFYDKGYVSGKHENPLRTAVQHAKSLNCKSICIEY